jgi:arabinofuranosyltransferase
VIFYLCSFSWLLLLLAAGVLQVNGHGFPASLSALAALGLALLSIRPWAGVDAEPALLPQAGPKGKRSKAPLQPAVVTAGWEIPPTWPLALPLALGAYGQLLFFRTFDGPAGTPPASSYLALAFSALGLAWTAAWVRWPRHWRLDGQAFKAADVFVGLAGLALFAWYAAFIWHSSFVTGDPTRRIFCLFDDAMVSLRYARNLVLGRGLVWNVGEKVEGFTNPLMTLLMAFGCLMLEKERAALFAQVLGLISLLAISWQCRGIFLESSGIKDEGLKRRLGSLAFFVCVLYYPTAYWTLLGMETGLMGALLWGALLLALKQRQEARFHPVIIVLLGLASWTRPDGVVPALMILGWRWASLWRRPGLWAVAVQECVAFAAFPLGLLGLQKAYYGDWLPNTYTLKLTGLDLAVRLASGLSFVKQFLATVIPLLGLALVGMLLNFNARKALVAALFAYIVVYQYRVGGDPWLYWRMFSPFVPLLVLLSLEGAGSIFERLLKPQGQAVGLVDRRNAAAVMAVLVLGVGLLAANKQFFKEMAFGTDWPESVLENKVHTSDALYLKKIFKPGAKVGCTWAGVVPYFSDAVGVDFLGKCDKKIAAMKASPTSGFNGMPSVPGHNKYDLKYSIETLKPDYIQTFYWIGDDERSYATAHYLYKDSLLLRRGSPYINWNVVKIPGADVDPDTGVKAPAN